jgi:hypothetical protein
VTARLTPAEEQRLVDELRLLRLAGRTREECAEALKISLHRLERLIRQHQIPANSTTAKPNGVRRQLRNR